MKVAQSAVSALCALFLFCGTPEASTLSATEPPVASAREIPLEVSDHLQFDFDLTATTLIVRVEGYFDSVAVKGVDIRLVSESGRDTVEAYSDRKGEARLFDLLPGRWSAFVNGNQHEVASAVLRIGDGAEARLNIQMQKKVSILWMILTVLGGLGIFLYGMNAMSSGLQTVAGPSLRKLVATLTSNRFLALLVGVGVTSVVQSSSITTVMVVGFVNSGIMHLREALGVIMGANIGTTVTAWILVLAVDKWGLPLLGVSAFIHLFTKQEKIRYAALAVMGIGMVFFGLELMKNGFSVMKDSPEFLRAFSMFTADSYVGVLKVAIVGGALTMIIQSSSATIGIIIALATQGIITYDTSVALVLGAKVGTTITAQLAAIGASADARRCAHFHTFFNLSGVAAATALFPLFMRLNFIILEKTLGIETVTVNEHQNLDVVTIATGIAMMSTAFNTVLTLIYLPIIHWVADLLEKFVSGKSPKGVLDTTQQQLSMLDSKHYDVPMTALTISQHELAKMGRRTREMSAALELYLLGEDKEANREEVFRGEAELDITLKEVTQFVAELLGEPLAESDIEEVKAQLRISDELESISDYLAQILKLYIRLETANIELDPAQFEEMIALHRLVGELISDVSLLETRPQAVAFLPTMEAKGRSVTLMVRSLRDAHWARLSKEKLDPLVSTVYGDLLGAYRKIKNHLINVSESRAGLK